MYERMLDKNKTPTENEIQEYIGKQANDNLNLIQSRLKELFDCNYELKFPFGNNYGWGYKVSIKKKHLMYLFFEKDSLTMMMKINEPGTENEINLLNGLSSKGKQYWDDQYPCGKGGWIHYRIETKEDLKDAGIFLSLRTKKPVNF